MCHQDRVGFDPHALFRIEAKVSTLPEAAGDAGKQVHAPASRQLPHASLLARRCSTKSSGYLHAQAMMSAEHGRRFGGVVVACGASSDRLSTQSSRNITGISTDLGKLVVCPHCTTAGR